MNVIFIPDYRNTNSYQTNLSCHLAKQGVNVYFDYEILRPVIKFWKPDILHVHWPRPYLKTDSRFMAIIKSTYFICQLFLLKALGIKIVWTVHNITDHEGKFKKLNTLFYRILARSCDKLIIHCPSIKTEIKKLYKDARATVIPHGNYIYQYKNTITDSEARTVLNLNMDDTIFLYFGQVRPYKGISELITTFKILNCRQTKLLIVGKPLDNKIKSDIKNSCKDNRNIIDILEYIPDDDIQLYMNAADIVVLPYKDVLTSGAAILAMSFGKPIIAPSIGCITDTLDNKGSFLYTGDNLSEAMRSVLRIDRETLLDMGKHNLKLVEKFGWSIVAKKTYDTYQECIE